MADIVADTNIVIWYFADPTQLSKSAETAVDNSCANGIIYVSSITIIELIYLNEKAKIRHDILDLLLDALDDLTSSFQLIEISRGIAEEVNNIPRRLVPDMPDRIIAATALHLDLPLITSDGDIRKLKNIETIW